MKVNERSASIDLIRCIACLSVVVIHVLAIYWINTPIKMLSAEEYLQIIAEYKAIGMITYHSSNWYTLSFCDALMRFCVPVFIMISGALVLIKTKVDIGYAIKKTKYIASLIIAWGGVISLVQILMSLLLDQPISMTSILQNIISGPAIFWFLFILLPLYIGSPIYFIIVNNKTACRLFLTSWFLFSILYPFLRDYVLHYDFIKLHYFYLFSEYSGYFVLGGYLSKYGIDTKLSYLVYIFAPISIFIMTCCEPVGYYHNYLSPFVAFYSSSVFIYLRNIRLSRIYSKAIVKSAQYTLGIYAIHPLIIEVLTKLIKPCVHNIYVQLPTYLLLTVFTSIIITYMLKKIPIIHKYI